MYICHVMAFLSVPHTVSVPQSEVTIFQNVIADKTVILYRCQQQSPLLSALGNYDKSKLHHGSIRQRSIGRDMSPGHWEKTSITVWSPTKYFSWSRLGTKAFVLFSYTDTLCQLITEPIEINEKEEQILSCLAKDISKPSTLNKAKKGKTSVQLSSD